MKGQIWSDFLILTLVVVLGVLIAFSYIFPTFTAGGNIVTTVPLLIKEEVSLEHETLTVYEIERLYYSNGLILEGPEIIKDRLRLRGVNIR